MKKPTKMTLAESLAGVGFGAATLKQPDEFTAEEAAKVIGKSPCVARRRLRCLVDSGKATRRPVTLNGVAGFFYRLL